MTASISSLVGGCTGREVGGFDERAGRVLEGDNWTVF